MQWHKCISADLLLDKIIIWVKVANLSSDCENINMKLILHRKSLDKMILRKTIQQLILLVKNWV